MRLPYKSSWRFSKNTSTVGSPSAGFDNLERECKRATKDGGQIWADNEPRTIAELHGRGVKVAAARKGKGSRPFGLGGRQLRHHHQGRRASPR